MKIFSRLLNKPALISLLIISVGFVFLMLPAFPYGWRQECVAGKCGILFADIYRARDDLWHMALAQVAFDTVPFRMPILSGGYLQSYHFLYSAILSIVVRSGVSVNFGYYVVLPIIWFFIYTFLTIQIAKKLTRDNRAIPFFLFFAYFSSGLSFLLSLRNTGSFWHDIGWFSNQPGEYMINPTLALSLIIFQLIILVAIAGISKGKQLALLALLIFLMWGSKFYGGVVATVFVGMYLIRIRIHRSISVKKLITALVAVVGASVIAILFFYNPFASLGKGGIFAFEPFKTMHPMIEDPELLPILRVARLRYMLYKHPVMFWPAIVLIEQVTISLYMIFTLGTRLLGFGIVFAKEKLSPIFFAILGSSIVATLIPIFLTQKGGDWFNTIQFLGYTQFLLQIAIALYAFSLYSQGVMKEKILLIMILATAILGALNPIAEYGRHITVIAQYVPQRLFQPPVYVSSQELDALRYLQDLPEGTVFTFPYVPMYESHSVKPLWKANDTAYISALGDKQLYLANTQQLDLVGIDHAQRTHSLKNLNKINVSKLPVEYFYLQKEHPSYRDFTTRLKAHAVLIFENREVEVWEKK